MDRLLNWEISMADEKEDMDAQMAVMQYTLKDHIGKTDGQFNDLHGHLNRHRADVSKQYEDIMESVRKLTDKIDPMTEMIELYNDRQGFYKTMNRLKKVVLWFAGIGVSVGALYTAYKTGMK